MGLYSSLCCVASGAISEVVCVAKKRRDDVIVQRYGW